MLSKSRGRSIEELVDEQIRSWEDMTARKVDQCHEPVIAISRQEGTCAPQAASRLADALQMHLYDDEIVGHIADDAQATERMVRTLDEHGRSYVFDFIEALQTRFRFGSDKYFDALLNILGTIHFHGNGVILGHGSTFVLNGPQDLRVRFVAPLPVRIQRLMQESGLSESEAKKRIRKSDKEHEAFASGYFQVDIDDPQNYDLIINDAFMSLDTIVDMLTCAVKECRDRGSGGDESGS